VSVTVATVGEASPPPDIGEQLGREVLDVRVCRGGASFVGPPSSTVVLVYTPAGIGCPSLAEVVRWAAQGDAPVAVMGCCPAGSTRDAEAALAAGFDDFVIGRVSPRELAARVRALARRVRGPGARPDFTRFGRLRLDPSRHQLIDGARPVSVTRTELLVIRALLAAQGRALSRAEILEAAWGDDGLEVGERAVDNVVMRLRRKLGEDAIVTVRGVGFRLSER
jgi:DNA-binding response OmpR family regulator